MQIRPSNLFIDDIENDLKIITHTIAQLEKRKEELLNGMESKEQQKELDRINIILRNVPQLAPPDKHAEQLAEVREHLLALLRQEPSIREAEEITYYDAVYGFLRVLAKHYPLNLPNEKSEEHVCIMTSHLLNNKAEVIVLADGCQLWMSEDLFDKWDYNASFVSPLGNPLNIRELESLKIYQERVEQTKRENEDMQPTLAALAAVMHDEHNYRQGLYGRTGWLIGLLAGLVTGFLITLFALFLTYGFIGFTALMALPGVMNCLITCTSIAGFGFSYVGTILGLILADRKHAAIQANMNPIPDPNNIAVRRAILEANNERHRIIFRTILVLSIRACK